MFTNLQHIFVHQFTAHISNQALGSEKKSRKLIHSCVFYSCLWLQIWDMNYMSPSISHHTVAIHGDPSCLRNLRVPLFRTILMFQSFSRRNFSEDLKMKSFQGPQRGHVLVFCIGIVSLCRLCKNTMFDLNGSCLFCSCSSGFVLTHMELRQVVFGLAISYS